MAYLSLSRGLVIWDRHLMHETWTLPTCGVIGSLASMRTRGQGTYCTRRRGWRAVIEIFARRSWPPVTLIKVNLILLVYKAIMEIILKRIKMYIKYTYRFRLRGENNNTFIYNINITSWMWYDTYTFSNKR